MPRSWRRGPEFIQERFFAKVHFTGIFGCWEWKSAKYKGGYGIFYDTKVVSAHRWAFMRWIGPVPDGLELDHRCRNRSCVNPWHLEPVTRSVNVLRGTSPKVTRERNLRNWRAQLTH